MRSSIAALLLLLAALPASAVTLYDAAAGTTPAAQGWSPLQLGAAPVQGMAGGRYTLDTTGAGVGIFGNALQSAAPLDTVAGFTLSFGLRIAGEAHIGNNRAGYSVLVTGADPAQALEIAFWQGNVWIYDFDAATADRFIHGADAALDTGVARTYTLLVAGNRFALSADGTALLAGSLRDYTSQGAPYTTPNGLFFGDDTSRGASVSELAFVTLSPVPEPATPALLLAGGALLLALRRRPRS